MYYRQKNTVEIVNVFNGILYCNAVEAIQHTVQMQPDD